MALKRRAGGGAALALVLATACATSTGRVADIPTADERARLERVALYDAAPPGAQAMGTMRARVCQVGLSDAAPTPDEALAQLRLQALRNDADVLVMKGCSEEGMNVVTGCVATITCSAVAFRRR